ncbi:MAG: potassium channel family protein [Frankiaceae bacterium]
MALLRGPLLGAALLVLYFLVPVKQHPSVSALALLAVGLLAVTVLAAWQVRAILRSPAPRLRAVTALAIAVQLFVLVFAGTYFVLGGSVGGSFTQPLTRLDALYFTTTVLSTVGFGDIVASSETARAIVMAQMVGDIILVGIGARLLAAAVQLGLRRRVSEQSAAGARTAEAGTERVAGP